MSKDWTGNSQSLFVCNGASNHSKEEREINDYYATEPKAVEWLMELEPLSKAVWECACGEGHLAEPMIQRGHDVYATDLYDRGYGIGGGGLPEMHRYIPRRYNNQSTVQVC